MLVLTRKTRESIMIGDDVEVTVLSTDGAKVRLGISAPAEVPVHRTEIYLEIKTQGRRAAGEHQDRPARAASPAADRRERRSAPDRRPG